MKSLFNLLRDQILVNHKADEATTPGGIVLTSKPSHSTGVVVSVGPDIKRFVPGDTVTFRGTGEPFELDGETLRLMPEANVIGYTSKRVPG